MNKPDVVTNGLTSRVTLRFVTVTALSILVFASIGYSKIYEVTAKNSEIRIERAGHAAAIIFAQRFDAEFEVVFKENGTLSALRLSEDTTEASMTYRDEYDTLLASIGEVNEGAANLFKFNFNTLAFDRFATTFRTPSGKVPPPMSIAVGHPAYQDLMGNSIHCGEVPVMGRLRLAKIIPIQNVSGQVVGALAVDVGWVDDLVVARNELLKQSILFAVLILTLQAMLGVIYFRRALSPIRTLAIHNIDKVRSQLACMALDLTAVAASIVAQRNLLKNGFSQNKQVGPAFAGPTYKSQILQVFLRVSTARYSDGGIPPDLI